VVGEERVDLGRALQTLGQKLGVLCVVSTAGGQLNGALLRAGLIDEVSVEFFPAIIGGRGTPALFDAPPLRPEEQPTRLKLLDSQVRPDGKIWLRYSVIREEQ
jgi:2,5-diamino-6-(ribosylamino)-4(3H)-pyrimidinone 5'-phosphate reductase